MGGYGASDFILETIRTGYKIPFIKTPEPAKFKNNWSALRNGAFVETAIDELLEHGGVIELESPPTVVNPLTVSESGEKNRLTLDLRYVNAHEWLDHVKFEDFKPFQHFIHIGSFMTFLKNIGYTFFVDTECSEKVLLLCCPPIRFVYSRLHFY